MILELLRLGADLVYLRSEESLEVDALVMMPDGQQWLVQVCSSLEDPAARMRVITSLKELAATPAAQAAQPLLISLDRHPPDLGHDAGGWQWRSTLDCFLDI